MKTITVGTGAQQLCVSTYTMGSGFFGTRCPEDEAYRILDYYYEKGGRSLDTARYYGVFDTGKPQSELILGKWLAKTGVRKEVVLSSKGGHPGVDTTRIGNPNGYVKRGSRLTREELTKDIEASLESLRTDQIDIYWLHRDEPDVPVDEIMTVLNQFVQKGYTKLLGASNWRTDRIEEANRYALAHGMRPFAASQLQWSLALNTERTCFDDTSTYLNAGDPDYSWYQKQNMPIFAFSSQAGGLFSRALADQADPKKGLAGLRNIRASLLTEPENLARIERARMLCAQTGLSAAEVCTSYLLSKELPVTVLLGCRTMEQLKDSFSTHIDHTFDPATVRWLETGLRPTE